MKPIQNVRIAVAADEVSGRSLINLLSSILIPQATLVASTREARARCEAGAADACVVVIHNFSIEDVPTRTVEEPAPAKSSILLADVVTPYVARTARRSGYAGVAALSIAPRLLYRLIGGALQKGRRARPLAQSRRLRPILLRVERERAVRVGHLGGSLLPGGGFGKIKLSS
jgi:hypothetical protein